MHRSGLPPPFPDGAFPHLTQVGTYLVQVGGGGLFIPLLVVGFPSSHEDCVVIQEEVIPSYYYK